MATVATAAEVSLPDTADVRPDSSDVREYATTIIAKPIPETAPWVIPESER
jgi:hypothetical protein